MIKRRQVAVYRTIFVDKRTIGKDFCHDLINILPNNSKSFICKHDIKYNVLKNLCIVDIQDSITFVLVLRDVF